MLMGMKIVRLQGLSCGALVSLALLVLLLAGCGRSTPSTNPSSAPLPPSAAVGYWRSPPDFNGPFSYLVCIRLIQGRYFLWLPPATSRALLTVEGNRLVRHIYHGGTETEREVFWARPGNRLAVADYVPVQSGTTVKLGMVGIGNFTKATGSAASLAVELHGRFANGTIEEQVQTLMNAIARWVNQHGGYPPPRAVLLPGGAFWKWHGAPHLTNAFTGGPMVLGSGVGNFDYRTTSGGNWYLSGHLYGGGEATQSEGGG